MQSFFSQEMGQPLAWFGIGHLLLLLGFFISIFLLNRYIGRIKTLKFEPYVRVLFLVLVLLFEFNIFQNRLLNSSIFRIPLCGIALYLLTYAVMFKKEDVFKISYFYIFGAFLTYLFFDTPWGLDRWQGWTYFGSHAMIVYLAVYGYQVFGFKPEFKDLLKSMMYLAIYALISGYGTFMFGGSDELFLFHAPVDFLNGILSFSQILYVVALSLMAIVLMFVMYIPFRNVKHK
jgi:uncharacterized membrane protein YwaF